MLDSSEGKLKWVEFKKGVRSLWEDITLEEIEQTEGNIGAVAEIIHARTGETKESIQDRMESLIKSFLNETDSRGTMTSSFERSPIRDDHKDYTPPDWTSYPHKLFEESEQLH
jgi:glycerophosphoryl diester phosphodiesterase